MTGAVKVEQVANTLLTFGQKFDVSISNLSLQKLIFFAQGFHYLKHNTLLFDADIEAWNFGPVIPDIYHQFKKFGKDAIIGELACYFDPSEMTEASFPKINERTNLDAFAVVNDTFALLAGKDPFDLVEYSHRETCPWKATKQKNVKIEIKESDKLYFKTIFDEAKAEYDEWSQKQST